MALMSNKLQSIMIQYPIIYQLFRFGIVGMAAASVHFSIVVFLVEMGILKPLLANAVGFCIAFQVSYSGHRFWTFRGTSAEHHVAFFKLFLVSSLGFAANQGLYYVFLNFLHLPYMLALLLLLSLLPIVTFVVNKLWVFRSA